MKPENLERRSMMKKNIAVIEKQRQHNTLYPEKEDKVPADWVAELPGELNFFEAFGPGMRRLILLIEFYRL